MELNDFLPLLAVIPVTTLDGLVRIGQNFVQILGGVVRSLLIGRIILFMIGIFSKPFYLAGIVIALTYFPETIQWVFMKIGEIQLKIFAIGLGIILPDVFGNSADVHSWAQIWNSAFEQFPPAILDVLAKVGLAELMGIVTSCLTAGSTMRLYFKMMNRAVPVL